MSLFSLLTPGYPFSLGTQDYSSLRNGLELLNILNWFFNFLTFCLLFTSSLSSYSPYGQSQLSICSLLLAIMF